MLDYFKNIETLLVDFVVELYFLLSNHDMFYIATLDC